MKFVVVTGAGQGIGGQIAKDLDDMGLNIILTGRNKSKLQAMAEGLKQKSYILAADLSKTKNVENLAQEISHLAGPHLHGLVNNAGIFIRKSFETSTIDDWQKLFATNLLGPSQLTAQLLPCLRKSTAPHKFIINISSTAAERPVENTSAYGALKLAFTHMSKVLALEVASDKICVNVISPGVIDTPIHNIKNLPKDQQSFYQQLQPLQRVGQPQDISSMVKHLAQEQSQWITGSNFIIDGGLSLK